MVSAIPYYTIARNFSSAQSAPIIYPDQKVTAYFRNCTSTLCGDAAVPELRVQYHFSKSKEAILEAAKGLNGTALILGIGAAHDIPLEELAEQFTHIDVVDIDVNAVSRALQKLPLSLRNRFRVHKADLTGRWKEFGQKIEALDRNIPEEEFGSWAFHMLSGLFSMPREKFLYAEHTASFVISSLIISQLSWCIDGYLKEKYTAVYGKPLSLTTDQHQQLWTMLTGVEEAHMEDLRSWVAPEGRVYFADTVTSSMMVYPTDSESPTLIVEGSLSEQGNHVEEYANQFFKTLRRESWYWEVREGSVDIEPSTGDIFTNYEKIELPPGTIPATQYKKFRVVAVTLRS